MRQLLAVFFLAACALGQTTTLDQNWQLLPDPDAKYTLQSLPKDGWRPVRVGLSWNAQFDDMRDFGGVGWYRTTFSVPQFSTPHHVLLKFGACDYFCEVFVNGKKAGEHEGGYTPFEIEVKDAKATNELIVRVSDPPRDETRNKQVLPQFMYDEVPHGKQGWYVNTGGLWQSVTLEIKSAVGYITRLQVSTTADDKVEIAIAGKWPEQWRHANILLKTYLPNGREFTMTSFPASPSGVVSSHPNPNPQPWSPDTPNLYTAEVTLRDPDGATVDVARTHFGFRSLTTHDGKLYLNGKPFYMIGALDQDFYPSTIYTPPSPEYLRDEMRKAKALGLNTLRCHIKVCTPEYLDAADEVGMLIWYEIPSWNDENHWTQRAADRGMKVFREALERDWNHPSLAIQSIINESWGADLTNADQRKWLAATYDEAKKLVAPLGRLIVDNSACCENFHVKSDLADFHQYYSIPDHADQWSKWVSDFASRPKWIWSPHGDAQSTGKEPLIVSEFGNWGLPKLPKDVPWWFNRDFNGRSITMPAGVLDRFHQYKLDRIFSSYDDLAGATQWHQFESLKYEIEEMRSHPEIQGYVITEFTDVNWESNGVIDIWRNPKVYAKELAQIQQQDSALIDWKHQKPPKQYPVHQAPVAPVTISSSVPGAVRQLSSSNDAPLLVASGFDQRVQAQLNARRTVILLADSSDALPKDFPVQLKARANSNYNGDWISNFNWILPSSPVFENIAFNKIMGFEAEMVTPNFVMLGLKPEQFDDVLAGAFYGWINNNCALVLQAKYGKGKLLVTTFRFDQYGRDPYATTLLDNMIRYAASEQFQPKLVIEAK